MVINQLKNNTLPIIFYGQNNKILQIIKDQSCYSRNVKEITYIYVLKRELRVSVNVGVKISQKVTAIFIFKVFSRVKTDGNYRRKDKMYQYISWLGISLARVFLRKLQL